MKKNKWRILILLLIVIAISFTVYWRCKNIGVAWYAWRYRQDANDACVQNELDRYFTQAQLNLELNIQLQKRKSIENRGSAHIEILPKLINKVHELRRDAACDGFLPFRIYKGEIEDYPPPLPASCSSMKRISPASQTHPAAPVPTPLPQPIQNSKKDLLMLAQSVGRLGIRKLYDNTPACTSSTNCPSRAKKDYSDAPFWGTGFLIAPDVVATTCHLMDPIMVVKNGKHKLHLDGEQLVIDFQVYSGGDYKAYRCAIDDVLACGSEPGVDVALLHLQDGSCTQGVTPPPPVTLDMTKPTQEIVTYHHDFALIGYADLDHSIDADTDDIYKVYRVNESDAQFVMGDQVPQIEECGGSHVEILMDFAITTIGESGAVMTDLKKAQSGQPLQISAMHTCCSAFFKDEHGVPPKSATACARLRRTIDNQAISVWSMLQDHDICTGLKDHGALSSGYNCP